MATHKHWVDDRKINVLVQLSLARHADLPHVPLIMDFAKSDEHKQIFKLVFARQPMGSPFLAPPGMPADAWPCCARRSWILCRIRSFWRTPRGRSSRSTRFAGEDVRSRARNIQDAEVRHGRVAEMIRQ